MNIIQELDRQIEKIKMQRQEAIQFFEEHGKKDLADSLRQNGAARRFFSLKAKTLKDLRIAAVMDQFTLESYCPECQLLELTPDNWREELIDFKPELVFIESAWKGKNDLWYRKIDRSSQEMYDLADYCHAENIPIVFWNKEDPVYTTSFMTTASLADFVFTTDIDCIQRYKEELGHDRVYHLHFAAQPTLHNPIEKYDRQDKFCFAGAYYHKYQHRAEVFDKFAEIFINTKGFDIYDRNYRHALPEHAFPDKYNPYILGSLPSSQIDKAYKGYVYGINMNSVQQSQTMFARRVFEMLASNTITLGNYSRGVKNYFGDLTICTDDARTMENQLEQYCKDSCSAGKFRLAGLRKVLTSHLYEDRLDYIVQKVFGVSLKRQLPVIAVAAECADLQQAKHVLRTFERQTYPNKQLFIICPQQEQSTDTVKYFTPEEAGKTFADMAHIDFYACISWKDYYGPNYLYDLALTCRYGNYTGVGKASYYSCEKNAFVSQNGKQTYRTVSSLVSQRSIIHCSLTRETTLLMVSQPDRCWQGESLFAIDEFNYCANYIAETCPQVDDLCICDQGISLSRIEEIAEHITVEEIDCSHTIVISPQELQQTLKPTKSVRYELTNGGLLIHSSLEDGMHEYVFGDKFYSLDDIAMKGKLWVKFRTQGTLDCICTCVFYDANNQKLEPQYPNANRGCELTIPENAAAIKIGFRPKGSGTYLVHEVTLGASAEKECFLSRSNVLVISNQYPTPDALYRNMFVHKRMICYKDSGYVFDVMRINTQVHDAYREFEGINVVDGGQEMLAAILESGQINTVCVHFLDEFMWDVLKNYIHKIKVLVWCHGSEIQPWWRREYNYHSQKELDGAKIQSETRMRFWSSIFSDINEYENLHFIFVSQYFADEVFEDNKIILPQNKYTIIHNCIDTEMFRYVDKPDLQRTKLLSIRPFASDKYANDLTVKCILELAKKEYFKELDIRIIGNGELFDKILKPLKKYKNIILEKRFLRQEEIAALHQEYGIFLVPTRMDAQGVSRDEAMSSGLVPVTNAVTAIPEFVDESCGILAPGEDAKAMAEGIDRLYHSPDLFLQMSANAADRVRRQTSREYTIDREIELIIKGEK